MTALAPANAFQPNLRTDERLLWTGVPKYGLLLRSQDAFLIPFSMMWGGFALFWELSVIIGGAPFFFILWGIPFVLMGAYITVGRFFVDAQIRKNTNYALTNERVIISSGLFTQSTTSLPLEGLSSITFQPRSDGSGTVLLGNRLPALGPHQASFQFPGSRQGSPPQLERIADAGIVHARLLDARQALRRNWRARSRSDRPERPSPPRAKGPGQYNMV